VHGKLTMCEYPYERKKASTAYIPEEYGKFKRELRTGEKVTIANSYYLQSAFWGGKSKFIIPCLKELQRRVNVDIENGYISSIIQDERSAQRPPHIFVYVPSRLVFSVYLSKDECALPLPMASCRTLPPAVPHTPCFTHTHTGTSTGGSGSIPTTRLSIFGCSKMPTSTRSGRRDLVRG
jgi:hypothetical protein